MPQPEKFETLILGSGQGGKLLAWHLARSGSDVAVVERQMGRRLLPERRLPAQQERNLERQGRGSRASRRRLRHDDRAVTIDMAKVRAAQTRHGRPRGRSCTCKPTRPAAPS